MSSRISDLSEAEAQRVRQTLTPRKNKYTKRIDLTVKQTAAALMDDVPEILFGGAAGGGKTDWLMYEALKWADHPAWSAILFRGSYPNLSHEPDGLIPRSKEWLDHTDAKYNGQLKTWFFPSR